MKILKTLPCLCLVLGLLVVLTGCPETAHKAEPRGMAYFTFFDTVSYIYSYAGDSEADFTENCDEVAALIHIYFS